MEMLLEQGLVPVEEEKIQEVSEREKILKEAETKGKVGCFSPFSMEEDLLLRVPPSRPLRKRT